jgi:hypothetical protein
VFLVTIHHLLWLNVTRAMPLYMSGCFGLKRVKGLSSRASWTSQDEAMAKSFAR